jgi:ParB-like chromosome segregation protein Spo0J
MTERPYQLLPPLSDEQRHLLRQSIEKNGVLEAVVFDEDGEILDGHHRVEIAEELGIEYPRRVIEDLSEADKQTYALTVNVARRQLSQSERGSLVARLRSQGMSIRAIADATGLPKSTVARDVDQLSRMGQLSQPDRTTGLDGKERPASQPRRTPTSVPDAVRQAVKDVTPEDLPASAPGEGRSAGLPSALSGADVSDASVVGDVAADELPDRLCEKCGGPVDQDAIAAGFLRCEACDEDGDHVDRDGVCMGCNPPADEPEQPARPPMFTPEQRAQIEADAERDRSIRHARKIADRFLDEVSGFIAEIEQGAAYGEPGLFTEDMVAGLRKQADRIENYLEVRA